MDAEFHNFIKELNKLVVNNTIPFLYYDTSAIPKYPLKSISLIIV